MKGATIRKALPPTIVVTLIFFLNYYLFGMENTIIGPFLTLSFLKFQGMEDYRGCMLRSFGIYTVMAVAAYLALLHPALNILCNGAALFWIGYFLIDEYNPLNYFPAGMALIFFQISPVPGSLVPMRILALAVSFLLVFLFLELTRRLKKQGDGALKQLVRQGLDISGQIYELLCQEKRSEAEELRQKLCRVNRQLSLSLYEQNRATLKKQLKENIFCNDIAGFQMINYLASVVITGDVGVGAVQLQQMKEILETFKKPVEEEKICDSVYDRLKFRENPMDIRSFRLRFALRQVLVMTPCLLYGSLSPWENGYWLAISVFFMMIPVYESTFLRVAQRIRGSLLGIGVCLVAFAVFRGFWGRVLLMTIANFFIYSAGNYASMVTCITCSALALKLDTDFYVLMLVQRMLYTLIGAVIAVGANLWVLRIRAFRQCQYVMELLEGLKIRMETAASLPEAERIREMNQIMVKSYLLSSRMEEFNNMAAPEHKRQDVEEFLKEHMLFTSRQMLSQYVKKEMSHITG